MKEKNIMNIIRLLIGAWLFTLYAVFDKNGTIILIAAFMLGFPLDVIFTKALIKEKEDEKNGI